MSVFKEVSINIIVKTTSEQPPPPEPSAEQMCCELWVTCESPHCFKHGCLNALRKQGKDVNS